MAALRPACGVNAPGLLPPKLTSSLSLPGGQRSSDVRKGVPASTNRKGRFAHATPLLTANVHSGRARRNLLKTPKLQKQSLPL